MLTLCIDATDAMKKKDPATKAQRLSTSIPAELDRWLSEEVERAGEASIYGNKPTLSDVVTAAIMHYKGKIERAKSDIQKSKNDDFANGRDEVRKATKQTKKKGE